MSLDRFLKALECELNELKSSGRAKRDEKVVVGIKKGYVDKGARYYIQNNDKKEFIRMNSNSYLGMSLRDELIEEEKEVAENFGVGPGAVRFISGTYIHHKKLEKRLARFHKRDDCIIFSSAYSTVMGILSPIITSDTIVISDELNHNCIINAIKLSSHREKLLYKHLDMEELENHIKSSLGKCSRVIVITDGIFSMRGDYAPLDVIMNLAIEYDDKFSGNIIVVVDDSHGVGVFGKTGRGTEEYTGTKVDILIGTLGKAFGVNGGYLVGSSVLVEYLREKSPFYIYSNPITSSEAAAAIKAIDIIDSDEGIRLLERLRTLTKRFENGLKKIGYEIIESDHPIVPVMIRDTEKTKELVNFLFENGILVTGLNYPVVPKGDEEIRFQISCEHTMTDIDYVLDVLRRYKAKVS